MKNINDICSLIKKDNVLSIELCKYVLPNKYFIDYVENNKKEQCEISEYTFEYFDSRPIINDAKDIHTKKLK